MGFDVVANGAVNEGAAAAFGRDPVQHGYRSRWQDDVDALIHRRDFTLMVFCWYYTHAACACQIRPWPVAFAIHGKREVTIPLPEPHEAALGVESLIFMQPAPAEMGRGYCGRNPASHWACFFPRGLPHGAWLSPPSRGRRRACPRYLVL